MTPSRRCELKRMLAELACDDENSECSDAQSDFEDPGSICAMCSHRECTCGESDLSAGSGLDDGALEVM